MKTPTPMKKHSRAPLLVERRLSCRLLLLLLGSRAMLPCPRGCLRCRLALLGVRFLLALPRLLYHQAPRIQEMKEYIITTFANAWLPTSSLNIVFPIYDIQSCSCCFVGGYCNLAISESIPFALHPSDPPWTRAPWACLLLFRHFNLLRAALLRWYMPHNASGK